jgi:hypothetical protein
MPNIGEYDGRTQIVNVISAFSRTQGRAPVNDTTNDAAKKFRRERCDPKSERRRGVLESARHS